MPSSGAARARASGSRPRRRASRRTAARPRARSRARTTAMSASSSGPWLIRLRPLRDWRKASSAVAVGTDEPHRRLGGVRALAAERLGDPPRHVGVVQREGALHPGAEDGDVVPVRGRVGDHGVEVEERGDDDALAALRRGDDRARPVRRRHRQHRRARLEVLARRVAEVEAVDPHARAARRRASLRRARRAAPGVVDLGCAEAPARSPQRAPGRSSRWPGSRRSRRRSGPPRPRPE